MQDRTYSDLLFLIQSLVGGGNLTTEEQGSIDSFINRRAHEAFQTSQTWPRFLVSSEERDVALYTLSGAATGTDILVNGGYRFLGKSSGSNTTPGTNVYQGFTNSGVFIYKNSSNAWIVVINASFSVNSDRTVTIDSSGQTIKFTETDTVKKDKLEDVVSWTLGGGGEQLNVVTSSYIPYSPVGSGTIIGEFNRIHKKRAFVNNSSMEYDFFVDLNGANILNISYPSDNFDKLANLGGTTAFVTYKKELPQYTITSIDIPGEWFFFMAHGAYADFLRMEGKVEQGMAEEEVAQKYLAQELEKVDNMSNNNVFRRFSTHGTRQSR